ncbi:MAG: CarD family transcriptional regulator [Alphaproteobacteria bacterium]|nr:CarD family transcriptional regulator [Alphaproteobacteria bacterium]
MVKENTFSAGEYVVYPTHGVGKITSISKDKIAGQELELIAVHFDKDRMTLRVPMAKAKNSGLRKLSTKTTMDSALDTLRTKAKAKRTMWSRRALEYEAKINSGDVVAIAEVVRDLYRSGDAVSEQSYSERQIYELALDRLSGELAAVDKIEPSEAQMKVNTILTEG